MVVTRPRKRVVERVEFLEQKLSFSIGGIFRHGRTDIDAIAHGSSGLVEKHRGARRSRRQLPVNAVMYREMDDVWRRIDGPFGRALRSAQPISGDDDGPQFNAARNGLAAGAAFATAARAEGARRSLSKLCRSRSASVKAALAARTQYRDASARKRQHARAVAREIGDPIASWCWRAGRNSPVRRARQQRYAAFRDKLKTIHNAL